MNSLRPLRKVPIYPKPTGNKVWFVARILRGLHSWIEVPNEEDYSNDGYSIKFLGLSLFLVNKPSEVKRIKMSNFNQFPKHRLTLLALEPLTGRSVFSVNGEEWHQQRILIDQAFKLAQLKKVFPQMRGAVDSLIRRLDPISDERSVEIDQEMNLVTADVIIRTILSRPLVGKEGKNIFEAFSLYQKRAGRAGILRLFRVNQQFLQQYLGRDARRIRSWIQDCISERKNTLHKNDHSGHGQDFLQAMMDAIDPNTGYRFNDRELIDQVCLLFLAGHETSASSLGMAAYLLSQYKDVQEKFKQEIEAILASRVAIGQDTSAPFFYEDLKMMPYGSAIFNETLRLYPPVGFLFHEPTETTDVLKMRCPLSSLITISPWIIQRHQKLWDRPNAFEPERFFEQTASTQEQTSEREAFLPFGLGPRKCPGAAFAMQEALLVLAEVIRRYELLPDSHHVPKIVSGLTIRSSNGIRVRLRRRSLNFKPKAA